MRMGMGMDRQANHVCTFLTFTKHVYFLHPLCLHTVMAVVLRNVPQPCWCYVCAAQAVPVVAVRNTFIKSFLCAAVHQVTAFLVLLAAV